MSNKWGTSIRRWLVSGAVGISLSGVLAVILLFSIRVLIELLPFLQNYKNALRDLSQRLDFPLATELTEALSKSGLAMSSIFVVTTLVAIAVLPLVASRWSPTIDLFLFAPFDAATLRPISRKTGLLRWVGACSSQREAWKALNDWAMSGATSGRSEKLWSRPRPQLALSCALLLGGTGSGKTQLISELARTLARRELFGSTSSVHRRTQLKISLGAWCRRAVGSTKRIAEDPWDAGCISVDTAPEQIASLLAWLPRRPSLIVMDELSQTYAREVLRALERNRSRFHYPVRIVIIDQSIPIDLDLTYHAGVWHTRASYPIEMISVGNVAFDENDIRLIHKMGFAVERHSSPDTQRLSSAHEDKRLWDTPSLRYLARITDGNPLQIALAKFWLVGNPDRELTQLGDVDLADLDAALSPDIRAQVQHRLVQERVQTLYAALSSSGLLSHNVLKAIGCATLVGGLPIHALNKRFKLDLSREQLKKLFPESSSGPVLVVGPKLIGDQFILQYVLPEYRTDGSENSPSDETEAAQHLLADAWTLSPQRTQKVLDRCIQQDTVLARAFAALSANPIAGAEIAHAFVRAAIFYGGSPAAAQRAISTLQLHEAAAVRSKLLQYVLDTDPASATLPSPLVRRQGLRIAALTGHQSMPDSAVALALYLRVTVRFGTFTSDLAVMRALLPHANNSPFASRELPMVLEQSLRDWLEAMLKDRSNPASRPDLAELLHSELVDPLWQSYNQTFMQAILSALAGAARSGDSLRRIVPNGYIELWESICVGRNSVNSAAASALTNDAERTLLARKMSAPFVRSIVSPLSSAEQSALKNLAALSKRYPHSTVVALEALRATTRAAEYYASAAAREVALSLATLAKSIASRVSKEDPKFVYVRLELARTFSAVASAQGNRSQEQQVVEAARQVDAMGTDIPPAEWISTAIRISRAAAWSYVAIAHGNRGETEQTVGAARTADSIVNDIPPDDAMYARAQFLRAIAWNAVAHSHSNHNDLESTLEAITTVESILSNLLPADGMYFRMTRLEYAASSTYAALVYSNRGVIDPVEKIARKIDSIVANIIPESEQLPKAHRIRVEAWTFVAGAYANLCRSQEHLELAQRVETVAQRIDGIMTQIPEQDTQFPIAQCSRASAWGAAARAYGDCGSTEDAVRAALKVDDLAAAVSGDEAAFSLLQVNRIQAWKGVVNSCGVCGNMAEALRIRDRIFSISLQVPPRDHMFPSVLCEDVAVWAKIAFFFGKHGDAKQALNCALNADSAAVAIPPHSGKFWTVQIVRAEAYLGVVYGCSKTGDMNGARKAAQEVSRIRGASDDQKLLLAEKYAWDCVAEVCDRQRDPIGYSQARSQANRAAG